MKLSEVNTEFQRKPVLVYGKGKNQNKVVNHFVEVQPVPGTNFWKTANTTNQWGEEVFSLYLFFPEAQKGILVLNKCTHPERYDMDVLAGQYKRLGYTSAAEFLRVTEEFAQKSGFVKDTEIAFIRQWEPERAAELATLKQKQQAEKCAREAAQEAEKRATEEAQRKAEEEAKQQRFAEILCGWEKKLTPMAAGRALKILEKHVRYNGKAMTESAWVKAILDEGYYPSRSASGDCRMVKDNYSYNIKKTLYDFAVFLLQQREIDNYWNSRRCQQ